MSKILNLIVMWGSNCKIVMQCNKCLAKTVTRAGCKFSDFTVVYLLNDPQMYTLWANYPNYLLVHVIFLWKFFPHLIIVWN